MCIFHYGLIAEWRRRGDEQAHTLAFIVSGWGAVEERIEPRAGDDTARASVEDHPRNYPLASLHFTRLFAIRQQQILT